MRALSQVMSVGRVVRLVAVMILLVTTKTAVTQVPGAQQGLCTVIGRLADTRSNIKTFPEVTMTATRVWPTPTLSYRAKAGTDGNFEFLEIPAGVYAVCSQSTDGTIVDDCGWTGTPPRFQAVARQTVRWIVPVMRARPLTLRVVGAGRFAAVGKHSSTAVAAGAKNPVTREFIPARYAGEKSGVLEYSISLPVTQPVEIKVRSDRFDVDDPRGVDHQRLPYVDRVDLADPPGRSLTFTARAKNGGQR